VTRAIAGFAVVLVGSLSVSPPPRPSPEARATRVPLEPVPYEFHLDGVTMRSHGRTIFSDAFDRGGSFVPAAIEGQPATRHPYFVNMGAIDGSYVRDGALNIDHSCSINPFENFAFDFSLPVDERGSYSFYGRDLFDLEVEAVLRRPRVSGPEKFKVGLVDDQLFFGAAMISLEKDKVTLHRQGGEPRTITPFLETTFDEVDLRPFGDIEELTLRLSVDRTGRAIGFVTIRAGGSSQMFRLTTDAPWARLNPLARYSAHVFVEDLARPRVFSVYPETVTVERLRAAGGVLPMKVFGIGFGEDSTLELVPDNGAPISQARPADILMFNMGLKTTMHMASVEPASYTVRVSTAGLTATVAKGLRVLP
jgi:hypothetical protein